MAIGTAYRLSAVAKAGGALHVNTFWFRQRADTPDEQPAHNLVQWWINNLEAVYCGCFPGVWQLQEYNVWVSIGSPENFTYLKIRNGALLLGGYLMPTQCTGVVTWTTDIAGRRFRGRSYIGALQEGGVNSQELRAAWVSAVEIFAFRLVTNTSTTSAFDFVINSKKGGHTQRVTGAQVRSQVYTQRRRTAAYGE